MSDTLTIRRATPDDAAEITRHRYLMFEEVKARPAKAGCFSNYA